MKTLHLKPAPGRECPLPDQPGKILPEKGDTVERSVYWQRRLQDGDAVLVERKAARGSKV